MLPSFCNHALWLFGVLVALAMEEAIKSVVPHLLLFSDNNRVLGVEALRLMVFGLMIVRHYLGAAYLFEDVHAQALQPRKVADPQQPEEDARLRAAQRQFGVDFFTGLLHFTLFSAWALTLEAHHVDASDLSPLPRQFAFQGTLLFILVYDFFWLLWRPKPHPQELKFWTTINMATAMLVLLSYHVARASEWTPIDAEVPGLLIVVAVSVFDIMQLTMNTNFISRGLTALARKLSELARFR